MTLKLVSGTVAIITCLASLQPALARSGAMAPGAAISTSPSAIGSGSRGIGRNAVGGLGAGRIGSSTTGGSTMGGTSGAGTTQLPSQQLSTPITTPGARAYSPPCGAYPLPQC